MKVRWCIDKKAFSWSSNNKSKLNTILIYIKMWFNWVHNYLIRLCIAHMYTLRIIQRENKFGKKAGEQKKQHWNGSKEKELIAFETLSVTYGRRDTKRFKLFMSCLFFFFFIYQLCFAFDRLYDSIFYGHIIIIIIILM